MPIFVVISFVMYGLLVEVMDLSIPLLDNSLTIRLSTPDNSPSVIFQTQTILPPPPHPAYMYIIKLLAVN